MISFFIGARVLVAAAGPLARGRSGVRELLHDPMEAAAGSSEKEDLPLGLNNALKAVRQEGGAVNGDFTKATAYWPGW